MGRSSERYRARVFSGRTRLCSVLDCCVLNVLDGLCVERAVRLHQTSCSGTRPSPTSRLHPPGVRRGRFTSSTGVLSVGIEGFQFEPQTSLWRDRAPKLGNFNFFSFVVLEKETMLIFFFDWFFFGCVFVRLCSEVRPPQSLNGLFQAQWLVSHPNEIPLRIS